MNLEPFVHTAELGSFTAAAKRLGVSVAAVSKAVARLEGQLGVSLLARTSRSVVLTPEGAIWLAHAKEALQALEAGRARLSEARDAVKGPVRITASPVLGEVLADALGTLSLRHPGLELSCAFTDAMQSVAADEADLAVRVGAPADSALVARKLATLGWLMVASPTYLGSAPPLVHPDDLLAHRCISFLTPTGRVATWRFRGLPSRTLPGIRLGGGNAMVAAAVAGVGVTQAFAFMAAPSLARGALVRVLDGWDADGPDVHLLWRRDRARARRFRVTIDHLVTAFAQRWPGG